MYTLQRNVLGKWFNINTRPDLDNLVDFIERDPFPNTLKIVKGESDSESEIRDSFDLSHIPSRDV